MRHFQVMLLAVLAIISLELGVLIARVPPPIVQAQTQPRNIPTPGPLQDPHDVLRVQLTQVQRELAAVQRSLAVVDRQVTQSQDAILADVNERTKVIDSHLNQTCRVLGFVAGKVLDMRLVNFGPSGACGWQMLQ